MPPSGWSECAGFGSPRTSSAQRIAEDADNRPARHAAFFELQASDERLSSILMGNFAGSEIFPAEIYDDEVLRLVRAG